MGSGASKKQAAASSEKDRAEVVTRWISITSFGNLPEDGLKEFREFLSTGNQRRLDFYMQAPNLDLLREYIEDGPNMLDDATDPLDEKQTVLEEADRVSQYISKLKERMQPDLQSQFDKFKEKLEEDIKR